MNCQLEIKQVPFMGTNLVAAQDNDGQIWAGVRWMCDGIGLSSGQTKSERLRIQGDKVLSKGGRNLVLPTKGGNQETLCLKLDFVPLWLAKISITPNMVAETPELAATLEQYQLRAKDVLAAAFLPICTVPDIGELSPELRLLINMELRQKEQQKAIDDVNQRLDDIKDVVALSPNSWRPEARGLIVRIARQMGGNVLDGSSAGEELGHYQKAATGLDINFMIVHKPAVMKWDKHIANDLIPPSINPDSDSYILKYRKYGIVDVYNNKTAGIYLSHKAS